MSARPARQPLHEQVAARLVEQLRAGTAPWQRPWAPGEATAAMPTNPSTGKRYRGINAIHLMAQGCTDPRWLTYRQAAALGGHVRVGERGTTIQYWKFEEEHIQRDASGQPVVDAAGQPVRQIVRLERPRMFLATVFNAEQVEGLPARQPPVQAWADIERAERILAASGAQMHHAPQDRAFYRLATDTIHLPERGQFREAAGYYATALHELAHWTGHPARLARDLAHPFGSEAYAREELRAEIASLVLASDLGLPHDPGQHAAYVGSWIRALQDDPLEVFRAAADAERISRYVLMLEHQQRQAHAALPTVSAPAPPAGPQEGQAMGSAPARASDAAATGQATVDLPPEGAARRYLQVPFAQNAQVRALGACWDRQARAWYVPDGVDAQPLARWMPAAAPDAQQAPRAERTARQATDAPAARQYLAVPYDERAAAKAAGARWDRAAKSWYVGPEVDAARLARWLPGQALPEQLPAMAPREEFAQVLRELGCLVVGEHPIMDGRTHRIAAAGDRRGEQAGFYVAHLDGHPAGYVRNHRTGVEQRWKAKGYALDVAVQAQLRAEARATLAARAAGEARRHEATAARVVRELARLMPAERPTAYLAAKGLAPTVGVRTDAQGTRTWLPATDAHGKVWTMQVIDADGTKRFAPGGRKQGCFHAVGGLQALQVAPVVVIAEGYATAASLADALGFATVAAFDSGNLVHVARVLHARFPGRPIIVAGDDDRHLEATQGVNPGRTKALEAARAVGGQAVFPVFAPTEQAIHPSLFTDFNDLVTHSTLGRAGLKRQARAFIEPTIQLGQPITAAQPLALQGPAHRFKYRP